MVETVVGEEQSRNASMATRFRIPLQVKVVRGLSPKAWLRPKAERHEVNSVCVLRLRFFGRGVEEESW